MNKILKNDLRQLKERLRDISIGCVLLIQIGKKTYQYFIDNGIEHLISGTTEEEIIASMKMQEARYFANDINFVMMGVDD